ncbi:MAG: iron-containing alcohol dehydrogenase [Desulfarculus sp.]|nr:iron-containing alcohol dehydrogenase [Pseudomonadota bacterium]MBV1715220.1 iron-containing alcohol dehydrogenase [Desulfarculus sp.]MBU4576246.1 iron-containing alcohol dehydrogenase [Pseudomonadota bacterium]MBU4598233.1 iron-containing alcohol dehydrogenase [Pseudomonadota bacterium]MBV1739572.1 iron-containing alcohol dehydrogenase [Desulfarculus sp.]
MKTTFYEPDKLSTFLASKKTLLAKGAIAQAGPEAKKLGAKKVMVVTDAGVMKAGLADTVRDSLSAAGLEVGVFDGILPEPPARVIDQCAEVFRKGGYDLCLGLGGGSSLDSAKIVSNLAANPGSVLEYVGMDMLPKKGTPLMLVPTTAGTGSEATRVMVLTDESDNTKKVVFSDYLLPDVSILDPELTLSVPPSVTADTGLDALVHAIETHVSVNATPYSDILSLQAIAMIARHLPQAYAKGGNLLPRYNMLLAANLSGSAFASGGLGAVHGLAYVLGTEYHMAHGRSNAIMLPHVMAFNLSGNLEKFAGIAEAMGEDITGLSPYEAAALSVEAVYSLMEAVNLSARLTDYGVSRDDLPKLVKGGMAQARLFVPNPRDLTEADVEQIYSSAF